jgi:hypothetical protein
MFLCKTRGVFMRTVNRKAYACITILIAALFLSGCGDDGAPVKPADEVAEFKPLTTPENLIHNLVLSYDKLDIARYAELLLSTAEGGYGQEYYWFHQEGDATIIGEESIPRSIDVQRVGYMFAAANNNPVKPEHTVIDKLELEIYDGVWVGVDSLWGEPCEDCWHTKRHYYISILLGEDTIYGDDFVEFYVVPIQEGEVTTYRIAMAFDVLI